MLISLLPLDERANGRTNESRLTTSFGCLFALETLAKSQFGFGCRIWFRWAGGGGGGKLKLVECAFVWLVKSGGGGGDSAQVAAAEVRAPARQPHKESLTSVGRTVGQPLRRLVHSALRDAAVAATEEERMRKDPLSGKERVHWWNAERASTKKRRKKKRRMRPLWE